MLPATVAIAVGTMQLAAHRNQWQTMWQTQSFFTEEYEDATARPTRKHPTINSAEGCKHAVPLPGPDLSHLSLKHYFSWSEKPEPRRDKRTPVARTAKEMLDKFNECRDRMRYNQEEVPPAVGSLTKEKRVRRGTCNWQPAASHPDGTDERFNKFSDVEMYFKHHEGEARVWSPDHENWVPFIYKDSPTQP